MAHYNILKIIIFSFYIMEIFSCNISGGLYIENQSDEVQKDYYNIAFALKNYMEVQTLEKEKKLLIHKILLLFHQPFYLSNAPDRKTID
jgi:hypothetical protein